MSGAGAFNGSAAEKRRLLREGSALLFHQGVPGVDEWAAALLRELGLHLPGKVTTAFARRIPVGFVFGDQERTVLRGRRLQRVLRVPLPEHEAGMIREALTLVSAHVPPVDPRWSELEERPGDWPAPVGKAARETRQRVLSLMRTFTQDMPSSVRDVNMADRAAALIGPLCWDMELEAVRGLFKKLVSPGTGLSCACWSEDRRVYARVINRSGTVVATLVLPGAAEAGDEAMRRVRAVTRVQPVEYVDDRVRLDDLRAQYAAATTTIQSFADWANADGAMRGLAHVLAGGPGVHYRLRYATGAMWDVERVRGGITGQAILLVGGEPPMPAKTLYYARGFSETAPSYG